MQEFAAGQPRFGVFTFDLRTGELLKGGTRIRIPDQSIEILRTLLERPGQLITREELRQRLWPDNTYVDFEHGLNVAVRRLRDALGDSADAPRYIETLPRRGYRFIESVVATPPGTAAGTVAAIVDAPATPERAGPVPGGRRRERIAWTVVAVLTVVVIALVTRLAGRRPSVEPGGSLVRFEVAVPENATLGAFALSPDGRHLVFATSSPGEPALWLKSMSDATPPKPLVGTEDASYPFWAPDSRRLGFFARKTLKTISIDGGPPDVICDALDGRGGTWNQQNVIVFVPTGDSPLQRVGLSDRRPVTVTTKQRGDTQHRDPSFLPDGRHFLYWAGVGAAPGGGARGRMQIGSLDSGETKELAIPDATAAIYRAGHIIFRRSRKLMAQSFDLSTRRPIGEAFSVDAGPTQWFSVSATGVLATQDLRGSKVTGSKLTIVDRQGRRLRVLAESTWMLALSPDEAFIATSIDAEIGTDVHIVDVASGRNWPLTFDQGSDWFPVWGPDSQSLVFTSNRSGRYQLFRTSRNTSGKEQVIDDPSTEGAATDWSRDNKFLALTKGVSGKAASIWIQPLTGNAKAFQFRDVPAVLENAHFSPDNRWMAFSSDESGKQKEVYIASFPDARNVQRVSIGGGTQPQWRADGSELFFFSLDGTLMSAAVTNGPKVVDVPRKLFHVPVSLTLGRGNEYAASRDGQRFFVNIKDPMSPIIVTVNAPWTRTP
jgi:Tol biopolymer transport system component/DNA-binding winged helix-turn-helix (wHTH) protein